MMKKISDVLFRKSESNSNIALIDNVNKSSITYYELQDSINSLAQFIKPYLNDRELILVISDKSIETIILYFSILKCNACYTPLNIENPDYRIQNIVKEANAAKIIIQKDRFDKFEHSNEYEIMNHSILGDFLLIQKIHLYKPKVLSANIALILFTSGSTGVPKGIMLSHQNIIEFILWSSNEIKQSIYRTLSIASFQFDLSIFDIFVTFNLRGTLILNENKKILIPFELCKTILNARINVLYMTPSTLRLLNKYSNFKNIQFPDLKYLLLAGEQLFYSDVYSVSQTNKNLQIYNLYGPSETNVCCSYQIKYHQDKEIPVPIGNVIGNFKYSILDENRKKNDKEGLLYITGPGLFNDYISYKNDFYIHNGIKYYNTGDIVSINNNELTFKGRKDNLTKKNGYRIELGEIENSIYKMTEIESCVVLAKLINTETLIIAFLVLKNDHFDEFDFRVRLTKYLPKYMLPDKFYYLDKLPLNDNYKVDYGFLRQLCENEFEK